MEGVFAPVVTPFLADLSVDPTRYLHHCRWLLSQDCGLAVFGTNSEANSLSLYERRSLLDMLVANGVPASRMMPGTGCNSLPETVELTRHAVENGAAGVLMLPPFYYKGVSDEGLFRYFSEVVERVADDRLRIYLYHIPPIAQVPITLSLIERLLSRYAGTVMGMKDSSGDWANTEAVLRAFPAFRVFVGSESLLLRNMRAGGIGCISATANVNPAAIHALYAAWRKPEADALQAGLDTIRDAIARRPMIAALKATIAAASGDSGWKAVRPPLEALDEPASRSLATELSAFGFSMPGVGSARK